MRTNFWTGLAGVIVGALLVSALPAIAQDAEPQAAPGSPFLLGQTNTVQASTGLRGTSPSNLVIRNTGSGVPLNLITAANGKPPMKVDSRRLVRNLNADKLDFKDADDFLLAMWAKVDADADGATLLSGNGVAAVGRVNTGGFSVTFDADVSRCGWIATRQDNFDGVAGPGEITIELGSSLDPATLWVRTFDSSGTPTDPSDSDGFTIQANCGPDTTLASPDPAERAGEPPKESLSP